VPVLGLEFGVLIGWPAQLVSPKTQNPKLKTQNPNLYSASSLADPA
jgi:hypothetical protein